MKQTQKPRGFTHWLYRVMNTRLMIGVTLLVLVIGIVAAITGNTLANEWLQHVGAVVVGLAILLVMLGIDLRP